MDLYLVGTFGLFASTSNRMLIVRQLSLFTGDLFQALGVVVEVKWINLGRVESGTHLCTAQGINDAAASITFPIFPSRSNASSWRGGNSYDNPCEDFAMRFSPPTNSVAGDYHVVYLFHYLVAS